LVRNVIFCVTISSKEVSADEERKIMKVEICPGKEKESIKLLLKQLRKTKGWTQQQLASAAGVPQPVISRIEGNSKKFLPSIILIKKLALAMGYEISLNVVRKWNHSLIIYSKVEIVG
jgi:DNA-binding XRE family transcriptional regulator